MLMWALGGNVFQIGGGIISSPPLPPPQVLTDNNFYDSQYHGIQLQIFRHVKHDCVHGTVLVIYQT